MSAGIYFRYDNGTRKNALFNGFTADGVTMVSDQLGGDFSEVWVGPYIRGHYKNLFLSFGYGLIGSRTDEGRPDVVSTNGSEESFSLDPSVAWMLNLGGLVPISEDLSVYFGIEYRARYYNQRGGENLVNDIVLGTQNFTPLIGVNYSL